MCVEFAQGVLMSDSKNAILAAPSKSVIVLTFGTAPGLAK
jgi:hypothetical protein